MEFCYHRDVTLAAISTMSPLDPPPLQVGDVYPEFTQLKKGEYTVRLMLRHDSQELLEKLSGLTLVRATQGCVPLFTTGLPPLVSKGVAALSTPVLHPSCPPSQQQITDTYSDIYVPAPAGFSLISAPSR